MIVLINSFLRTKSKAVIGRIALFTTHNNVLRTSSIDLVDSSKTLHTKELRIRKSLTTDNKELLL